MSKAISHIDLMVTNVCNMQCSYCYHKQRPDTLTLKDGKKILDRLKELYPESMKITFFGGEPTLVHDTVLGLAKYARSLWPNHETRDAQFTLTTNGTFFDEDWFKEWRKLGGVVQVSIDGDQLGMADRTIDKELIHKIYTNVLKIGEIIQTPYLTCRLTYTPENVSRLSTNIRFIVEELKIPVITHHAVMEAPWDKESLEMYRRQLDLLYQYRRFLRKRNLPIGITFIDKDLSIIDGDEPMDTYYCGAGREYVAIMPNGDVHPCHRAASADIFKLGNIFENPPIVRGMFEELSKITTGCMSNCPAARTCHSCPITHFLVNGDLKKPIKAYCNICRCEDFVAMNYTTTDRLDRQDKFLTTLASVVADIADQINKEKK